MFKALDDQERVEFAREARNLLHRARRGAGICLPFAMTTARLDTRRKGGRAPKSLRSNSVRAKHFNLIIEASVRLWPRHLRAKEFGTTKRDRLTYAELAH